MSNESDMALTIVVGSENHLGNHIRQCFLDDNHHVLSVDCLTIKQPINSKIKNNKLHTLLALGDDPITFIAELQKITTGKLISNVVFCQELNTPGAVMNKPIENWKKNSYLNVEVPLIVLDALASSMTPSSHVLFLSQPQSFIPTAQNGHYSASKTAIAFLMHALRLESPNFSVSKGVVDILDQKMPAGKIEKSEDDLYRSVAIDVLTAMQSDTQVFLENEWDFPTKQ